MRIPKAFPLLAGVAVAVAALLDHQGVFGSLGLGHAKKPEVDPQDVERYGAVLAAGVLGGWDLSFEGRALGHFRHREDAVAAYRKEAKRMSRWPDLYETDSSGGLDLLDEFGDRVAPW